MKHIVCVALLFLVGALTHAELAVPFFGNNNFNIDAETTFSANTNDGSTGLLTDVGIGLWFEFTPYADRNITPQRDALSVSLKLANSAFYGWRGYGLAAVDDDKTYSDMDAAHSGSQTPSDVRNNDQSTSVWFDTFYAQLEYNQWWMRIAGIEPEITMSQASIRSVFDPVHDNRTDIAKNRIPLPLFYLTGTNLGAWWSHGAPGITSVINRDIVHLDRREVEIAGNLSAGMKGEIVDFDIKGGSWKKAEENTLNAWVLGADAGWRPDLSQTIRFSFLTAMHYGTVKRRGGYDNFPMPDAGGNEQGEVNDPQSNPQAMAENPIALGLGYEYRFNLPGRMVLKPYAGIDFVYETKSGNYNVEFGGGLQWYFRGTSVVFKRDANIGGVKIGDVEIPAALIAGMNVDKNGFLNAIISFNEDPHSSPLPNLGGWFQFELMNLSGKPFTAVNDQEFSDFLWAGIIQIEYLVHPKVMPYIFARYTPADMRAASRHLNFDPFYDKDIICLTSKLGCRFTPFNYFSVDVWYERTDLRAGKGKEWELDNGLISICFGIRNYL